MGFSSSVASEQAHMRHDTPMKFNMVSPWSWVTVQGESS